MRIFDGAEQKYQYIQRIAYFLWLNANCPLNLSLYFWLLAEEECRYQEEQWEFYNEHYYSRQLEYFGC